MKKMKCPNCGRRAFDISKLPKEEVEVTLKCPQCGKFVSVPCNEEGYLSGLAYVPAAEAAGLTLYHTGAKKMMQNKRYLGDDYYPAIIDNETFVAAEAERVKRQAKLGRVFDDKPAKVSKIAKGFKMPKVQMKYDDPFKQAEYVYSLIESEVDV